jgi:hypothetical protein
MTDRDTRPRTDRERYLLERAADSLADLSDPFGLTFLTDHKVSVTECVWLARELSRAARYYLGGHA